MKRILVLICILFALTGCVFSRNYVVKIGNDKISRGEYLVYLMEQKKNFENQGGADIWEADFEGVSAEEIAKQNAVNTLVMVKTAVKQTKALGIALSQEDKDNALTKAEELMAEFKSEDLDALDLNIDKIREITEEVMLQQKVYDYVTGSYAVNEAEFNEYLNRYYSEHKSDFTAYTIKEIFLQSDVEGSENRELINKAFSGIKTERDFNKALNEISPQSSTEASELDPSLYTENTLQQIYAHNKGDCFLVEDIDGYHIFYITDVVSSPLESIEPQIKEAYVNEKKQAIYQNQSDVWQGDMVVEKNNDVWNNISIVHE